MEQKNMDNALPLYLQLQNDLQKKIREGVLAAGDKLPSERELCEQYGVSRITVRQALSDLAKDALIYKVHGMGTFVSRAKVEQQLFAITPFNHSLLSKGLTPKTHFLDFKISPNTYHLSKTLNIPIADNIAELNLLGLGDDEPMAFYNSFFSLDLGYKMKELATKLIAEGQSFTTLDLYSHFPEISLGNIHQTFEASIADSYISGILKIKKGSPVLIVESTLYSAEDICLEHRTVIYRGDKYKFSIVRKLKTDNS